MLPKCHKNVFSYLMAFLQELLQHSSKNHLDVHILGKGHQPPLGGLGSPSLRGKQARPQEPGATALTSMW